MAPAASVPRPIAPAASMMRPIAPAASIKRPISPAASVARPIRSTSCFYSARPIALRALWQRHDAAWPPPLLPTGRRRVDQQRRVAVEVLRAAARPTGDEIRLNTPRAPGRGRCPDGLRIGMSPLAGYDAARPAGPPSTTSIARPAPAASITRPIAPATSMARPISPAASITRPIAPAASMAPNGTGCFTAPSLLAGQVTPNEAEPSRKNNGGVSM